MPKSSSSSSKPRSSEILTTDDRCHNCEVQVGKSRLRQCGACRLARYCSAQCQSEHWAMHKAGCKISTETRIMEEQNPEIYDENAVIVKWLAFWRGTLFEFGIHALDLANHSIDRMQTHVVFLEVTFTPGRRVEKHRALQMHAGMVIPRERFAAMMREQDISPSYIKQWEQDQRGPGVLQMVLVCGAHIRNLWAGIDPFQLRQLCDQDKERSRREGETWANTLEEMLKNGQPTGFPG